MRVRQVRAYTCPWARTSMVPRFSRSLYMGASRTTEPEMSTSPSTTVSPTAKRASPDRASMPVMIPEARATMSPSSVPSTDSGVSTASRTSTSARVPWRLTDSQDSPGRFISARRPTSSASRPGP